MTFIYGIKPKFEKIVVVDFFDGRLSQKVKLIKNQQNIKNAYSLSLNFFGPQLTFMD